MTEQFQPTLLLSMPQLQDPNFARTVVLLCDYVPEGAFGLVLNRPTDEAATVMVRLDPPVEKVWPAVTRCFEVTPDRSTRYTLTAESAEHTTVSESFEIAVRPK